MEKDKTKKNYCKWNTALKMSELSWTSNVLQKIICVITLIGDNYGRNLHMNTIELIKFTIEFLPIFGIDLRKQKIPGNRFNETRWIYINLTTMASTRSMFFLYNTTN